MCLVAEFVINLRAGSRFCSHVIPKLRCAAGEFRDYALDALPDRCLFSVYRRASEAPLYQIEKCPADARKQGAFSVKAMDGRVLRRGHDLARVLEVLEPKRMRVVSD